MIRSTKATWDVNFQKIVPGSQVHRFKHSAHEPQIEETDGVQPGAD